MRGAGTLGQGVVRHRRHKNRTYEDYLGIRGLKQLGKKKWQRHVA
jgi:hypothetical protein